MPGDIPKRMIRMADLHLTLPPGIASKTAFSRSSIVYIIVAN